MDSSEIPVSSDRGSLSTSKSGIKENWLHSKKKTYGYRERSGSQTAGIYSAVVHPAPGEDCVPLWSLGWIIEINMVMVGTQS
jgi:hypothetical protein